MLAIVNGVPKVMPLKEVLGEFLSFRREIIINRTTFDLNEAEARAHILEGLKKALESIDEIISLIKKSKNPEEAKEKLVNNFKFSLAQSKAILDMRLQKLTSLETGRLIEELNDLNTKIIYYKKVLESHEEQSIIIKKELEAKEITYVLVLMG